MVDYQSGDAWPSYVGQFEEGIEEKKHFLKCFNIIEGVALFLGSILQF